MSCKLTEEMCCSVVAQHQGVHTLLKVSNNTGELVVRSIMIIKA